MTLSSAYDTAADGTVVHTLVRLLWEEDEPFADRPFRTDTYVGGPILATSHHRTATAAKQEAAKMHAAYLTVHEQR